MTLFPSSTVNHSFFSANLELGSEPFFIEIYIIIDNQFPLAIEKKHSHFCSKEFKCVGYIVAHLDGHKLG